MYRAVSIIVFLVTFAGIAVYQAALRGGPDKDRRRPVGIVKKLVWLLTLVFLEQRLSLLGRLKKLVYLLALLCFVILAVTGFYPVVVLGGHICGYLLMIHVTAGGVFAVCMAALGLSWADEYRFDENDWPWLTSLVRRQAKEKFLPETSELVRKAAFWLILVVSVPLMLSIVLSMFPLFGTAGQNLLANTHRYSTLVFSVAVIVHTYLVIGTAPSR